jgi:Fe-Mn family superoxide dismutase
VRNITRRDAIAMTSMTAAAAALGVARPVHAARQPQGEKPVLLGPERVGPLVLSPLPYPAGDLEPFIDQETMEIHHGRHHKSYVDNGNRALSGGPLEGLHAERILTALDRAPEDRRTAIRNNVGGHVNHALFWATMAAPSKGGGGSPTGALADAINAAFGSFDQPGGLKDQLAAQAVGAFGSGWGWLIVKDQKLAVASTPNQDSPLMGEAVVGKAAVGTPILGVDVWEHAYYLKYRNKRADYVSAWWNVVNWPKVAELHAAAL